MLVTASLLLLASLIPAIGAVHARRTGHPHLLIGLFVTFSVVSQIFAAKIATFDLGFTSVNAPAAVLIFAVTFLLTDIVNERFGRAETLRMIVISFVCQAAMVAFSALVVALSPAPFWSNQESWETVFALVPRITAASLVVFLVTESFDAYVFAWFKKLTKGRHLWARNALSSIPALTLDTVLFVTLAFAGTGLPLWELMLGQFVAKWTVGVIDIPLMYLNRALLGTPKEPTSNGHEAAA